MEQVEIGDIGVLAFRGECRDRPYSFGGIDEVHGRTEEAREGIRERQPSRERSTEVSGCSCAD
jgi:hypothetical protein